MPIYEMTSDYILLDILKKCTILSEPMKLKLLCLLTASLLISTSLAQKQVPPQAAAKTKVHPNEIFFLSHGIQSIQFDVKEYRITTNQPYEGVTTDTSEDKSEGKVTVWAGREKAYKPAASWFRDEVGNGFAIGLRDKNPFPKKLNFALKGTLTFIYSDSSVINCNDILIAQGSVTGASINNWWLGAKKMSGTGAGTIHAGTLSCSKTGARLPSIMVFTPKSLQNDSNHFNANPQL